MSDLSRRLAELSPEQLALLSRRAREKSVSSPPEAGGSAPTAGELRIPRRDHSRPAPLSFAQERLWLIEQLGIPGGLYNVPAHVSLAGELGVRALEQGLGTVVRRHEILRTHYRMQDEAPVQIVDPHSPSELAIVDLSGLPTDARGEALQRLASADASRPFELAAAPPLRAALVRRSAGEHALLLTLHHVACDGWSSGLLLDETTVFYAAGLRGRPSGLPEPPIQYADFAVWQRERLTPELVAEDVSWWRRRLPADAVLELPTDRPRPPVQTFRGGHRQVRLESSLRDALAGLARRHRASLFTAILALLQALLAHLARARHVRVGSPVSGRPLRQLEGLVGPFLNTLVFPAEVDPEEPFSSLLGRVREEVFSAREHGRIPFEKLVGELQPQRNLAYPPLFQAALNLEDARRAGGGGAGLPGLSLEPLPSSTRTAKFDLTLGLVDGAHGLTGSFEFNADLFDPTTVERIGRQLRRFAEAVTMDSSVRVGALPLLSLGERQQLVVEWNPRREAVPRAPTLDALFAARAAEAPDRIAVTWREEALSYGELDRRVRRLAGRLRREGIGPETIVAVAAERSPGLVVALLGVLAAGGAYLPLDPTYPAARSAWMLADSGAVLLLTVEPTSPIEPPPGVRHLSLAEMESLSSEDPDAAEAVPRALYPLPAPDRRLAYVLYTSGSTGRPKAVAVEHRQVARLLATTEPWLAPGPDDVWSLFHSYAFDFSVWEMWGALAHGGRLVVVPYWVSRSPEGFRRLVAEQGVTVLDQTPSAFRAFVEADTATGDALPLEWVLFGGEALDAHALDPWWRRHGRQRPRLVNLYGITETTVHVTAGRLGVGPGARAGRGSFIGRPLGDLAVHLLDGSLRPVPTGVEGEMWVGGAGVSRGYLGRPALTADRFRPDPFGPAPGERLYASGDLARTRGDGGLEHLGRADQQVQIRGFRIEPGEVEALLRRQPGIAEALVVARPEGEAAGGAGKGSRLVAYWVAATPDEPPAVDAIREALREDLPEHMLPSAFVLLDTLPRTPSGKLDRRTLPDPDGRETSTGSPYVAPRGDLERRLAALWAEVLEVERVGVDDNFFDLGGHSLLIVRLARRIREELERELPLMTLFRYPTVASLGRHLAGDAEPGGEVVAESRSRAERTKRALRERRERRGTRR